MLRAQRKELVDPQALIQQYQNEIADLRALLREKGIDGNMASSSLKGKESNQAMEKRLEELKSLILTSSNVPSTSDVDVSTDHMCVSGLVRGLIDQARPLSPMKLRYPKLNYDRSTAEVSTLHQSLVPTLNKSVASGRGPWCFAPNVRTRARDQTPESGAGYPTQGPECPCGRATR